jgi:hypothetical protein
VTTSALDDRGTSTTLEANESLFWMVSLQENTQPPFFWNARLSRLCMPIVREVDLVH